MSNHEPLAERMLERAMKHELTPEAAAFLEIRNRLLFGEGEVRDLSKKDDPELYGRQHAFNRLMLEWFGSGDGMALKPKRMSREARARRWHQRVDNVPSTSPLVLGVRQQDQASVVTLVREFSEAMEGIIDPDDVLVTTYPSVSKDAPIEAFEEAAVLERLKEELEEALKYSDDPREFPEHPVVDLYVRQEDKDRTAYWGGVPFSLKERIFASVKIFWKQNATARATWKKLYLTIHWGDEQEEIEVGPPRESET